ncbi:LuxR C-terminal-related transcriptional regulator [Larkinella insperata]|uniref:LuxR C-terminal-related transcriptional regulator n=1 Tax=Larkinella insperata TaxID=332158 RepID=A0ABW3Q764_9BACT|nr:LuxR C-terminal-related transcriptional regulator [Larkinella insperata]
MKTILIHTNDRLKADSLEKLLKVDGFAILGKSVAIDTIITRRPDIVLTDGIVDTTPFDKVRFVLLLPEFDSHRIADGLKANYWGFVLSDDGLQGLYDCLRSAQSGEKFFSTAVLERLRRSGVAVHEETVMKSIAQLSTREKEILRLIATGLPGHTIADRLFMSYRTLANHKTNMTEKLKLVSAKNLPHFAISVRDYL